MQEQSSHGPAGPKAWSKGREKPVVECSWEATSADPRFDLGHAMAEWNEHSVALGVALPGTQHLQAGCEVRLRTDARGVVVGFRSHPRQMSSTRSGSNMFATSYSLADNHLLKDRLEQRRPPVQPLLVPRFAQGIDPFGT